MSERLSNIVRSNDRVNPTAALHVEVIADLVCPFCYLGKRRLDDALQAVQGPHDVSWYPYQLNPELAKQGVPFEDYLTRRFGSVENIQPVLDELTQEGRHEGINFHFDRIERVPNTLHAHQLMHVAEAEGKNQNLLAEDLMAAFFEHGEDIGDTEVLIRIASRHGIEAGRVVAALEDDKIRQIVVTKEGQVRASGIGGVPGFLLNRRLLLIGAQEKDNIVNAFDRAMFGEGTDSLISPALN